MNILSKRYIYCCFISLFFSLWELRAQPFIADSAIRNPVIRFINDTVVFIKYQSIYDIHEKWDTVADPGAIFTKTSKMDYDRVKRDLLTAINIKEYNFIPLYVDDDNTYNGAFPGWIHDGMRTYATIAQNIGWNNLNYTSNSPMNGKIISLPHMNNVNELNRAINDPDVPRNYGSTLTLFHEIGHNWGVKWRNLPVDQKLGWNSFIWDSTRALATLMMGHSHWVPHRFVNLMDAGILPSGAVSNRFNVFDLYAMGISPYNDVKDSVIYVRDLDSNIYPVTVDTLINLLTVYQNFQDTSSAPVPALNCKTGTGRRIPSKDPRMDSLKTLIVVIAGDSETVWTKSDEATIMKLARDVPPDWDTATWFKSTMSTRLTHKMVNPIRRTIVGNSTIFTWNHFLSAYNPYLKTAMDGIRIESLPTRGVLSFNGLAVAQGQVFTVFDFAFGNLVYTKGIGAFKEDVFNWNVIVNGRWSVPASVKITPNIFAPGLIQTTGVEWANATENKLEIYPNPFSDKVNIVSNTIDGMVEMEWYDMTGKLLLRQVLQIQRGIRHEVELNALGFTRNSIVIMKLNTSDGCIQKKLFRMQ